MFHPSKLLQLTLAVLLIACLADTALGCPTCKDSIEGTSSHMVQGYFWSIIFMMSMPFLILGGLGLYFYTLVRRARPRRLHHASSVGMQPAID